MKRFCSRAAGVGLATILTLLGPSQAPCEELLPDEAVATMGFRSGDGEPRGYTRLAPGESASYLFCGEGELTLSSRAMLPDGARTARYFLELRLDGASAVRELAYRSFAVDDAFFELSESQDGRRGGSRGADRRLRAASLRRSTLEVARGCHTLELELTSASTPAVGVRLRFDADPTTKRRFGPATLVGGHDAEVVVRETRTPYRALGRGERAELVVEGPAWVRLLSRSMSLDEPDAYALVVEDGDAPYREVRMLNEPSRRARLAEDRRVRLGSADEVVFPVARGRHTLRVGPAGDVALALRAQVASRDPRRPVPGQTRPSWSTRARLSSYYDSNILRYSDRFIQRFDNGQDPGRFRVDSLDDVIQRVDVDVERSFTGLGGRPARVTLGLTHRAYSRNSIKDWSQLELDWRQDLGRGRRVTLFATMATDFYVRHLRDSDLTGDVSGSDPFQAFEFTKSEVGVRYRHELGASWTVTPELAVASLRHSPAFREFDSDNLRTRLRFDQRVGRRLRLSYAVDFTDSSAQGYDEPGETLATSDDTDPSYRQIDLMLAARVQLPTARAQSLFFQAEAGEREYTTSKPQSLAPFHNGRDDELFRVYGAWQIALGARWRLTVFGQFRDRSSSIPEDQDIGLDKNYEQYEAGLRLSARFD
ncbi:MAG: hypothetical protein AAGC60_15795 [Acidobacteriota bacterium]